jgi:hypothetical protein
MDNRTPVGELEPVTERSFALPSSRDGRYRVRPDTIVLKIEHDDGVYVVSDGFSTVYGTGSDVQEAVDDYADELYAYFDKLERREAALARGLRDELTTLRRYVQAVP